MKHEDLILEMKKCVGTQETVVFFDKMADVLNLLCNQIDKLQINLNKVKINSALSIQWEPKLASSMLSNQINILREDKDTYFEEISELKKAFVEDLVTQNYNDFCKFWQDVLGYHPFLEYK